MKIVWHGLILLLIIVLCESMNVTVKSECTSLKAPLLILRKRRHLTFPDDCDMVVSILIYLNKLESLL